MEIYTNNPENREFDKEALQIFCSDRVTITERQGASKNKKYEAQPTQSKTDSPGCLCIALHIIGVKGRMGSKVVSLAQTCPEFHVKEALDQADVAIDFSSPLATKKILDQAVVAQKPLVIGTTGHSLENQMLMKAASKEIPILFSPNFSLGMAACVEAAALIAKRLKDICSIDIVEIHHAGKKDQPSGSALALKKAVGQEVSIHSIRAGDTIGEHTMIFTCEGEKIELKHQVYCRNAFAKGALKAASFLIGKPPGLYSIEDLFYASH